MSILLRFIIFWLLVSVARFDTGWKAWVALVLACVSMVEMLNNAFQEERA